MARYGLAIAIATLAAATELQPTAADDPDNTIRTVTFERFELNHYYDPSGRHVLDQYIGWNRHPADGQMHVAFWTLRQPAARPLIWLRHQDQTATTIVTWKVPDAYTRIRARVTTETWTIYDPELTDRELLRKPERQTPAALKHQTDAEKKLLEN